LRDEVIGATPETTRPKRGSTERLPASGFIFGIRVKRKKKGDEV